jgi:hypothetical protein
MKLVLLLAAAVVAAAALRTDRVGLETDVCGAPCAAAASWEDLGPAPADTIVTLTIAVKHSNVEELVRGGVLHPRGCPVCAPP